MLINFAVSDAEAAKMYVSGHLGAAFTDDSDLDLPAEVGPGMSMNLGYDTGWSGLAAVGYEFEKFRLEAEFGYQQNDLDAFVLTRSFEGKDGEPGETFTEFVPVPGDLSLLTVLVNGYYSFANSSKFTPYVTAGLGFAYVELKDYFPKGEVNSDDTVFAYQLGAGMEYGFSEQLFFDLRYRYLATADIALDVGPSDTFDMEFASHNIYAGVRYLF